MRRLNDVVVLLLIGTAAAVHVEQSQQHFLTRGAQLDASKGQEASGVESSLVSSLETLGLGALKDLEESWDRFWRDNPVEQKGAPPSQQQPQQRQAPARQAPKKKDGVPAGRKGMYFRPVSVTLQCVMCLTIISLIVYTTLSISRNSDELSALFVPSAATQTLTIAARVAAFAPMMCMLFVGCRMYVLATTEGLGEPPAWVKSCMWTAVAGMGLQLLGVLMLPAFTKTAGKEEASYDMTEGHAQEMAAKKAKKEAADAAKEKAKQDAKDAAAKEDGDWEKVDDVARIDEVTGEHNDVHPALGDVETSSGGAKTLFFGLQIVSMLCLYGGLAGVIVGIITFPAQSTQISPAVKCTLTLSIVYFSVCFCLWLGRAISSDSFTNASLAMSSAVRKAPMFAVLFLASRMRALQLDPPYGMPPFWMQCCFYGVTALVILETIFSAMVGVSGKVEKRYYGVYTFDSSSKSLIVMQHSCAILSYCFLFPIIYGVYAMKFANGDPAPLSTTLKCVVIFEQVYFTIALLQNFALLAEGMGTDRWKDSGEKKTAWPMLREASLSAGISLGLCPILLILFVATRMRALQITQQEGDPPGWAQDCMLIAVFATCVQAFCCLVMPLFIGGACAVDEDGNPDYDAAEPMVGAYTVAIVKYVALMALHGSVMVVCYSVFAMTPETAHSGNRIIESRRELFKALGITVLVFGIALLFSSAKVIGAGIKGAIEACDEVMLGVSITVKNCALSLFKGYVKVVDLKVHNPEMEKIYHKDAETGKVTFEESGNECNWEHDYIAKIHLILLKVDVWRILRTLGKEFHLENLSIAGVHLNIEKPTRHLKEKNSNIEYILNHLDSMGLIPPEDDGSSQKTEETKPDDKPAEKKEEKPAAPPPDIPKIIINKIEIRDIGAGVVVRGVPIVDKISFHPSIGGFTLDNIQRDVFGGREDLTPTQTVACIIAAVAKKIFKTVVLEIPGQVGHAIGDGGKAAAVAIKNTLTGAVGKVAGGVGRAATGVGNFLHRKRTGSLSDGSDGDESPKASDRHIDD